jgi:hypothetical protein
MQRDSDAAAEFSRPLFYVVDWLPPDFGAVGQYALISAQRMAAEGRRVTLIGLTRGPESVQKNPAGPGIGSLSIHRMHAEPYEKTRLLRRLAWTLSTNARLWRAVLRHPDSRGADVLFTGAPPFMLYFAVTLKYLRGARLTYRITDFYPEAIVAHLGRRPPLLGLLLRFTWWLRRKVERFEVLGEDQRALLMRGGIVADRIAVKRYSAPVPISGREPPAAKPPGLAQHKVLLYSGNYGVAHEVDTVVEGFERHHRNGSGRFRLWLNATGRNADVIERRLAALGIPVARTQPVALDALPGLLAAADAHLITLRAAFAGIVLPSKVYACILSKRPIVFVGPTESDVHLLCAEADQRYIQIAPGDPIGFARALDELAGADR